MLLHNLQAVTSASQISTFTHCCIPVDTPKTLQAEGTEKLILIYSLWGIF